MSSTNNNTPNITPMSVAGNGAEDNASSSNVSSSTTVTSAPIVGGTKTQTGLSTTIVESTLETEGTTTFVNSGEKVDRKILTGKDNTFSGDTFVNASLQDYFARPVPIANYQWTTSGSLSEEIDPWLAWLTNPNILKKIDNYQYLRAKLHIKYVINASPFYYGRAVMCYAPLSGYKDLVGAGTESKKIILTQLPKIFIDPVTQKSGELEIPFFFPDNYINLETYTTTYLTGMGSLYTNEINSLKFANEGSPTPVDIAVYAWATDVELVVPTVHTNFTVQSGQGEYKKDKLLSNTATAVANAAGSLSDVPVIGAFAKATELGASAAAGILSIFGFSRPPVLADTQPVKPYANDSIANTSGAETVSKLSFDPKQETTISSDISGIANMDHMTFANVLSRECLINTTLWNTTSSFSGDPLFQVNVSPTYSNIESATGVFRKITMSPLAFGTMPFQYWSGTIIYRIQVVASKYHKGRLRISYQPNGTIVTNDDMNAAYNHIIDLDECRDCEFSISWAQAEPFKNIDDVVTRQIGNGTSQVYYPDVCNGSFSVNVVNSLSAPLATADASINIYARAGEDFQFFGTSMGKRAPSNMYGSDAASPPAFAKQAPQKIETTKLPMEGEFITQSSNPGNSVMSIDLVGKANIEEANDKSNVHHGEVFKSIRSILRRYEQSDVMMARVNSMNNNNLWRSFHRRSVYPHAGGENLQGDYPISGGLFSNSYYTGNIAYFSSGFAAYRGALRYKFMPISTNMDTPSVVISRMNAPLPAAGGRDTTELIPNFHTDSYLNLSAASQMPFDAFTGGYLNHSGNTRCHEVEFPYYNKRRFYYATMANPTDQEIEQDGSDLYNYQILYDLRAQSNKGNDATQPRIMRTLSYVAAGEDFNLIWFLNAPTFFYEE